MFQQYNMHIINQTIPKKKIHIRVKRFYIQRTILFSISFELIKIETFYSMYVL